MFKYPLYFLWLLVLMGCKSTGSNTVSTRDLDYDAFGAYWYQGKAEVNTYNLEQYRYGEKREGEAVLIYVTEDFSKEKQVKLDNPQENEQDAQKVLKLNQTKEFVTGIYPYSMMLSVFTPVYDSIPAVKVTASSQEWCGHTFTQLNRDNKKYKAKLLSYFEKENDQDISLDAMPEDNIWTLLRLNPSQVPNGKVKLIPALLDQRMTHRPLKEEQATISLAPSSGPVAGYEAEKLNMLSVKYNTYPRELYIFYTAGFPFEIVAWEEVRPLENGGREVTRATRKASMMSDYWTKNKNENEPLRRQLKLKN